ncbi:MAG: hypothetical protein HY270_02200 [Deltaproteobacteria bacterium]|nr:hypothetical protein [Deltaproteobacteria bacterium]
MSFQPPLASRDRCTAFAELTVPLIRNGLGKGVQRFSVRAQPSADPLTGKPRRVDADSMTLVCKP